MFWKTKRPSSKEITVLRLVALAADAIQVAAAPIASSVAAPIDVIVDVALFGLFSWRLGFHWMLLPTAVAEGIPLVDICPTWTAAVLFLTRKGAMEKLDHEKALELPEGDIRRG